MVRDGDSDSGDSDIPRGRRRRSTRRRGMRLRHVRDPRAARTWFVIDVVFVVAALVAVVVFWVASPDNTVGGVLMTVVALVAIGNAAWEMRSLWPVTGWSRARETTSQPD